MWLILGIEILVTLICVIFSSFAIYWLYLKKYNYWTGKNVPFVPPFPFFGNMAGLLWGESFVGIDSDHYRKYGKIFGSYFGTQPVLYIGDPELVKQVLIKDFNVFSTRRVFVSGDPVLDNFVSTLKGDDKWRNIRNTITPAFSTGKLKNMIPIITDCATITTSNFSKCAIGQEYVNAKKLYGNYTLDVIANVAFGTRLDSHNDPDNLFVQNANEIFGKELAIKSLVAFAFPFLGKYIGGGGSNRKRALDFFKDTTENIMERRMKTNEIRHDFLQLMMDSLKEDPQHVTEKSKEETVNGTPVQKVEQIKRKPLTKNEVLAQCILFFSAGYETTATTLTMVSYYLACNPEKQKKVLEEVDRIWENRETIDTEAVFEAKYVEAVIEETLRISPPGFRLSRTAEKDYQLADTGIKIPKGMVVEIPLYPMHHDPDYFPDPEEFRPERFLPRDNNEVIPYTFLPFGSGPRNCVAMRLAYLEIKMCLLYIFRHLEFSTCPKTMIPMEFLKRCSVLQPKEVLLSVRNRN